MDLQEKINTLEAEKKQYISIIENLNAEKTALDQMLVSALKESLIAKKDVLMKDNAINNLNQQLQVLLEEKQSIKNSLDVMQSDAQSGC